MFKQAGYQEAKINGGLLVSILHGTPVVQYEAEGARLTLQSGGWHTRATAKAMNRGIERAGLQGRSAVVLRRGCLTLLESTDLQGSPHESEALPRDIGRELTVNV